MQFLQSGNVSQGSSVPPGLKISLQGSEGPVSLDISGTRVDCYFLCALKEEPGQYPVPPDADANPAVPQTGFSGSAMVNIVAARCCMHEAPFKLEDLRSEESEANAFVRETRSDALILSAFKP